MTEKEEKMYTKILYEAAHPERFIPSYYYPYFIIEPLDRAEDFAADLRELQEKLIKEGQIKKRSIIIPIEKLRGAEKEYINLIRQVRQEGIRRGESTILVTEMFTLSAALKDREERREKKKGKKLQDLILNNAISYSFRVS